MKNSTIFRHLIVAAAALMACAFADTAVARGASMAFGMAPLGDSSKCGQRCPEVITAVGEITDATPTDFLRFVAANINDQRLRSIVFIHSPGGSVAASMRLGQIFRGAGVAVVVGQVVPGGSNFSLLPGGICYSACAYALMGAKKRVVPPASLVGIHRMSFTENERDPMTHEEQARRVFATPAYVQALAKYASSMGVSRDAIYTAEKIDPQKLHIVTAAELRRWRLGSPSF